MTEGDVARPGVSFTPRPPKTPKTPKTPATYKVDQADFHLPRLNTAGTITGVSSLAQVEKLPRYAGPTSARLSWARARTPKQPHNPPRVTQKQAEYDGLGAVSYRTKDGQTFTLPRPDVVLSTRPDALEVWPAVGVNTSRKEGEWSKFDQMKEAKQAKPQFLVQIESHVKEQLAQLPAAKKVGADLDKLAIFRNAWDYFNHEFPTYAPILQRVKDEFECMIDHLASQTHVIAPLQERLASLTKQCEVELARLEAKNDEEVNALKAKISESESDIKKLDTNGAALRDNIAVLRAEFTAIDSQCAEQQEANRAILADIQQLIMRSNDAEDPRKVQVRQEKEKKELEYAQERLSQALFKLNSLKQLRATLVPKSDMDSAIANLHRLTRNTVTLKSSLENVTTQKEVLEKELNEIREKIETLSEERDRLVEETRSFTPRPDWQPLKEKYNEVVELEGRTSRDILFDAYETIEKLRSDLEDFKSKIPKAKRTRDEDNFSEEKYFKSLGTGPDIPKFLRAKGKIRNRRLGKRDTELIIKDVWEGKIAHDKKSAKKETMANYFYIFLQNRFGKVQGIIAEMGYNVMDALQRYEWDTDCKMLLHILRGDMPEDVWHDQNKMLKELQDAMVAADRRQAGKISGSLHKRDLLECLQKFFPFKSDANFAKIKAEVNQQPGSEVEYDNLFEEDRDGNQTDFLELVRQQHLSEREDYLDAIEAAVEAQDVGSKGRLNLARFRMAIEAVDPDKPESEVNEILSLGFELPVTQLRKEKAALTKDFVKRLRSVKYLRTHTKLALPERSSRAQSSAADENAAVSDTEGGSHSP